MSDFYRQIRERLGGSRTDDAAVSLALWGGVGEE